MSERNTDVASRGESHGEDDIVCPWCGHVDTDSWEWEPEQHGPEGDGAHTCADCDKDFLCSRIVRHTYSTRRR